MIYTDSESVFDFSNVILQSLIFFKKLTTLSKSLKLFSLTFLYFALDMLNRHN